MADAQVSGTCGGNTMWVQLPSSAPASHNVAFYFYLLLGEITAIGELNGKTSASSG